MNNPDNHNSSINRFDFAFARDTRLRGSRPTTSIRQESAVAPSPTLSRLNLPHSVPREAPSQLAPLLDLLISIEGETLNDDRRNVTSLLSSMSMVYVLTTPIPKDGGDNSTVEQIRKRAKWDNNDYVCKGFNLLIFSKLLNLEKNYGIPWRPNIWLRMHQVRISLFSSGKIVSLFNILHVPNIKKDMVSNIKKDMVSNGLSQGFWDEAMLTACYLLNRVPNKRNRITPYEHWTKRKPNMNYLKDAIFDENRFSLVPRPSVRIPNVTEDIGGLVVLEEVTKEVVQQPKPKLRKSKRNRTPKDFGPEFQLYLIEGTRDKVSDQHSYCFNVEDDPKTFDEAMKSQDVVDLTKEFLSSRFSMKDMGEADVILRIRIKHESNRIAISQSYYIEKVLKKFNYFDCTPVSTHMDTSEKLMPNNSQAVS
ncbi:zinc finger, CCHC-type containing protein [Tanacetum coccineum]